MTFQKKGSQEGGGAVIPEGEPSDAAPEEGELVCLLLCVGSDQNCKSQDHSLPITKLNPKNPRSLITVMLKEIGRDLRKKNQTGRKSGLRRGRKNLVQRPPHLHPSHQAHLEKDA